MLSAYLGQAALGPNDTLPTKNGAALSKHIFQQQKALNLTQTRGFLNQTYVQGPPLYNLYTETIVPSSLFIPPHNQSQWFVQNSGGLRYGLYRGNVTMDDVYKVLPFRDCLYRVPNMRGNVLRKMLSILNALTSKYKTNVRDFQFPWDARISKGGAASSGYGQWLTTDMHPVDHKSYDIFYVGFDAPTIESVLVRYLYR